MPIVRERTKEDYVQDDSCPASGDLSALNYCWVQETGGAAGKMEVQVPAGQGQAVYAILLNDPEDGEEAALRTKGIGECRAQEAIDAGVECTVNGVNGRIEAAAQGDFICCITREAATAADHIVSVTIVGYYHP